MVADKIDDSPVRDLTKPLVGKGWQGLWRLAGHFFIVADNPPLLIFQGIDGKK